jgi:mono/diheme cytochrome c family protein
MSGSAFRSFALSLLLLLSGFAVAAAQQPPKKAPSTPTELSGAELFRSYCAPCHGGDARGNGPMAAVLKVPPPDLTVLSKRNNGTFPADRVAAILKNGVDVPAHGTAEMPIWGSTFADIKTHRVIVMRVDELIRYLESIQAK